MRTYIVCTEEYPTDYILGHFIHESRDCSIVEAPNKREARRLGFHELKNGVYFRDWHDHDLNPFAVLEVEEMEIEEEAVVS